MKDVKPPLSRRERKKAQLRAALIEAACRLFLKKGYNATTLEDISEECDVTVQTLLRYFGSKEDLIFERHAEIIDEFAVGLREATAKKRSIEYFRAFYREQSKNLQASEEMVNTYKIIEGHPQLLSKFHSVMKRYEDLLEQALAEERGVKVGEDLHSTLLANLLVSGVLKEALRTIGRGEIKALEKRIDVVFDYVLRTFRRPPARSASAQGRGAASSERRRALRGG